MEAETLTADSFFRPAAYFARRRRVTMLSGPSLIRFHRFYRIVGEWAKVDAVATDAKALVGFRYSSGSKIGSAGSWQDHNRTVEVRRDAYV